eukprot:scaffold27080_cov53-Phaeocystis_antarctica.AAC.2
MQGSHLSYGGMQFMAGAMAGGCLTHEQQAAMHVAGGIPPMHRPQLCWLPPQMVPQQMQMGMPPQIHLGAAATGSPQHQQDQQDQQHLQYPQYQQHPQYPQHPQHHHVGGCHGQSPLQPAQLGSPPPLACADAPSDAHISEQVTHLLSQRTHFSHTNLPQVLLGTYYG